MTHCNNIDEKIHLGCGSDCKEDVTDRKRRDREEAGGEVCLDLRRKDSFATLMFHASGLPGEICFF